MDLGVSSRQNQIGVQRDSRNSGNRKFDHWIDWSRRNEAFDDTRDDQERDTSDNQPHGLHATRLQGIRAGHVARYHQRRAD